MAKNRSILVTGGAGFVGSHSVELLLNSGYQVRVIDNLSTGSLKNLPKDKNLIFYHLNICEYEQLAKIIKDVDAVLHLAAIVSVPKSIEDPIGSFNTNVQGFLNVLRAIKASDKPIRLVYASSAAVYGNTTKMPCKEIDTLSEPMSPYALDKLTNEHYANLYSRLYKLNSLGLRYFNIYGPRQDPNSPYSGVISRFIDCLKKNVSPTIFGDGKQTRDFIYVKDLAQANLLALESSYSGIINIASGMQTSLLELIKTMQLVSNKNIELDFTQSRPGDLRFSYADINEAKNKISFKTSTELEDGLKALYHYST